MILHCLAFQTLPNIYNNDDARLIAQVAETYSDLKASMERTDPFGYCYQHLKEDGITSLLSVNISKCFVEFCRCKNLGKMIEDRVLIMHQCILNTEAGNGAMDIALFYRFYQTDPNFVYRGQACFLFCSSNSRSPRPSPSRKSFHKLLCMQITYFD